MTVEDNIAPEIIARLEIVALPRAPRGDRAVEPVEPGHQARHRADAGQVRHLVHRHALQPGRRAAAPVQRRHAAAQPRRHRDGPGAVHQGRAGRGAGARRAARRVRVPARTRARCRTLRPPRPRRAATSTAWRREARRARCASGWRRSPRKQVRRRRSREGRVRRQLVTAGSQELPFAGIRALAYFARVQLSATGFYATPKIHYDRKTLTGRPFFYFAYGAAVSEVGDRHADRRAPAARRGHPARRRRLAQSGDRPRPDRRRLHPGLRAGWRWRSCGGTNGRTQDAFAVHVQDSRVRTTCRSISSVEFFGEPNREETIYRSKAVGEPPLMLALSAFHALRDAVASVGDPRRAAARRSRDGRGDPLAVTELRERVVHARRAAAETALEMTDWLAALHAGACARGRGRARHRRGDARLGAARTGTAMIVGRARCVGTIGGGHLEFEAIRIARDALAATARPATGSCAFRWPRGSANAAAAWRRLRSSASSRVRRLAGATPAAARRRGDPRRAGRRRRHALVRADDRRRLRSATRRR